MKKKTGYEYYTNRHSCFLLQYHIVLVTKYRKQLLSFPNINNDIKTKLIEICKLNNYKIIAIENRFRSCSFINKL